MHTQLSPEFKGTVDGEAAAALLRSCVHCGFCNATCPTYQLLGDELDGPRGRIYMIKQVLEGAPAGRSTQLHLDRCLTCLNCQTTCPSGVEYGHLVDIGRKIVEQRVKRSFGERAVRWLLREALTSALFGPAVKVGRAMRPLLPRRMREQLPAGEAARPAPRSADWTAAAGPRLALGLRVLLPAGCVQPALQPNIDAATRRVLEAAGIEVHSTPAMGCCGALRKHLQDQDGARREMRRNLDAWWPLIEAGRIDAIVINASACSLAVKEYGHELAGDAEYAGRAAAISAATRDLSELLPQIAAALGDRLRISAARRIAYHAPCTLQHGQALRGGVEAELRSLGFDIKTAGTDSHLCCGSAGTYSLLQPGMATALRDRKLRELESLGAGCIASANIGCIRHLQSGTATPVRHWIEVLDDALAAG